LAQEKVLTSQDKVAIGLMHSMKDEKQQAWDILFPEAKAGNTDAMFHLGSLMARSPEYKDHMARAKTFFQAAAKKGHKGALAMLLNVEKQIELTTNGSPSIAGRSAKPTPKDLEQARRAKANYEQMTGRFVTTASITPVATVNVFITDETVYADSVADVAVKAKGRYGDRVAFRYFVVIDQKKWTPSETFKAHAAPRNLIGFEPDMNGQMARGLGVRRTPSIAIQTEAGRTLITSPAEINRELAGIMQ
jgi:TPR repeat protein